MPKGIPRHPKPPRNLQVPCKRCGTSTFRYFSTKAANPQTFCTLRCYRAWCEESAIAHFWRRVEKTDTCWQWKGRTIPGKWPYGRVKFRVKGQLVFMAHHAAWVITYGPTPKGENVLHRCDNPACVRPDHLFLGTQKDNMQDAIQKGRFVYSKGFLPGEKSPNAKLTWPIVDTIRQMHKDRRTQQAIAEHFNVNQGTIHYVVRHKTWKEHDRV